jgi:putative ABC transport system substrate-binding protein
MFVTQGVLATIAAQNASASVPIVCFACGDLTSTGLVESLARPGGNITGMTSIHPDATGKRLELLKAIVPGMTHVSVLYNSRNPVSEPELRSANAAAHLLELQLESHGVNEPTQFESAFSSMRREGGDGLLVLSDAMFHGQLRQIAELAAANRLPAISPYGAEFVNAGGLVGYGPDGLDIARRAAGYVSKILNGAKPGELPAEQPTKFELVINLKTARALGLTIPSNLLARADEVIE